MKPNPPTLPEIIERAFATFTAKLHVSMPGRVESYDRTTGFASVQPMLKYGRTTEAAGREAKAYAVLTDVPVMWIGGASSHLTLPLAAGDCGMLLFSEHAIDRLKLRGGVIDPENDRRFNLSDAVFIPGFRSLKDAIRNIPDDAAVLTAPEIRLGSSDADDPVALKSDLEAFKDGLDARIAVLSAGLPATATELATITAIRDALPPGWPVCAQKVKAE